MACYIQLTMQVFDVDADLLVNTDPTEGGAGIRGLKFQHEMQIHAFTPEQAELACRAFEAYLRQVLNESPDAHAVVETLRAMAGEVGPDEEDDNYYPTIGEILKGGD